MVRTTLTISGMSCGMCEAHLNDAVRKAFPVKRVYSSAKKGETVIESEEPIDPEKLRQVVNMTGYIVLSASSEEVIRKQILRGFFHRS